MCDPTWPSVPLGMNAGVIFTEEVACPSDSSEPWTSAGLQAQREKGPYDACLSPQPSTQKVETRNDVSPSAANKLDFRT